MADFDMDPDAVTRSISRLRAAGEAFGGSWERHKRAIEAGHAGIGSDVLAQAFRERYLPLSERLTAKADAIPAAYGRLCDDAMCCVEDYRAADARGTGTVDSITATDGPGTSV